MNREQFLQHVRSLRSEGNSIRAIAAELGVNRGRVDRALRAMALRQAKTSDIGNLPSRDDNPFVGRHREMTTLKSSLGLATSGRGQVVMLSGDPGIGKTRAAQELAAMAQRQNAHVFWGRCYDGEGAPLYWPWIQILRSYIRNADAEHLESVMGPGEAHIA